MAPHPSTSRLGGDVGPAAPGSQPAPTPTAAAPPPAVRRGPFRFAVFVAVCTLLLIKAGAMVTSTGSGMAYRDWPLADGYWWPPEMGLDGLFEHGHRAFASFVGLLVLCLTIWIGATERRTWLRRVAVLALGLVVAQGLIGALGIFRNLPAVTSVSHGVLAQTILCLLVFIAFALSATWQQRHRAAPAQVASARRLAVVALALVFGQLTLGAIVRHTDAQGMLWLHVFMALGVSLAILIAALYTGTRFRWAGFAGVTRWVMILLGCQLTLGFVTLAVRRVKDPSNIEYLGRGLVASSHVVVGALLFLTAALLTYRTFRNLVPDPSVPATVNFAE